MVEITSAVIGSPTQPQPLKSTADNAPADKATFGKWLNQSLAEADQLQQASDTAAEKLMTGESKDIHGTMIAMQKASIAFDLVMEIRNKVITAYEEIKRMQF